MLWYLIIHFQIGVVVVIPTGSSYTKSRLYCHSSSGSQPVPYPDAVAYAHKENRKGFTGPEAMWAQYIDSALKSQMQLKLGVPFMLSVLELQRLHWKWRKRFRENIRIAWGGSVHQQAAGWNLILRLGFFAMFSISLFTQMTLIEFPWATFQRNRHKNLLKFLDDICIFYIIYKILHQHFEWCTTVYTYLNKIYCVISVTDM